MPSPIHRVVLARVPLVAWRLHSGECMRLGCLSHCQTPFILPYKPQWLWPNIVGQKFARKLCFFGGYLQSLTYATWRASGTWPAWTGTPWLQLDRSFLSRSSIFTRLTLVVLHFDHGLKLYLFVVDVVLDELIARRPSGAQPTHPQWSHAPRFACARDSLSPSAILFTNQRVSSRFLVVSAAGGL